MADQIRNITTFRIRADLESLGAADLEELAWLLVALLENRGDLLLRGHDPKGNFIKGVSDVFTQDGEIAVECGTGRNYFDGPKAAPFEKPVDDVLHVKDAWPRCRKLFLFSTQQLTADWAELGDAILLAWPGANLARDTDAKGNESVPGDGPRIYVYDRPRIADVLYERLSGSAELVARFEPYLPSLTNLLLDFPYGNGVPARDPRFVGREELVFKAREKLREERFCVLTGVSGDGKTEIAKEIAAGNASAWIRRIWVDAGEISNSIDFASVSIQRLGRRLNLLAHMKEEGTIVVLDDWRAPLSGLAAAFLSNAHPTSVLLVTSQSAGQHGETIIVEELDRNAAEELLSPAANRAPAEVFEAVYRATGGNPLSLTLLRGLVEYSNLSWADIAREVLDIGGLPASDQTLAQKILARYVGQIGDVLHAVGFLNSRIVEPNLL